MTLESTAEMSVVLTLGGIGERHGGPSRTVTGLASALVHRGVSVHLVAGVHSGSDGTLVRPGAAVDVSFHRAFQIGRLRWCPNMSGSLSEVLRGTGCATLIHDSGIWGHCNVVAAAAAENWRLPYVVSPRGMMEPWALAGKRWRKRLAMIVFQRRILERASLLVATAESEYVSIRKVGIFRPVAIVPNGVDLCGLSASLRTHPTSPDDRVRTVLFMSRVHEKKGLINLLRAWAQADLAGWRLLVAGPDDGGHLRQVLAEIERLHLGGAVEYLGQVSGSAREQLLCAADVFVLPTFSENFGQVVVEALAHGVPVITTKGAPWRDLIEYRCGWWVDIGVAPLVDALRLATALPDTERKAMGERGRQYVRRYRWDDVAAQMVAAYRWVLGLGDRPACVRID